MTLDFFEGPWAKGAVVAVAIGSYFLLTSDNDTITDETANEQFARLLDKQAALSSRFEALETDGSVVLAHPSELNGYDLVACHTAFARGYSADGVHGTRNRQYAAAGYDCLFSAAGPDAKQVHVGASVFRSDKPGAANDGFKTRFLEATELKDLMARLDAHGGGI